MPLSVIFLTSAKIALILQIRSSLKSRTGKNQSVSRGVRCAVWWTCGGISLKMTLHLPYKPIKCVRKNFRYALLHLALSTFNPVFSTHSAITIFARLLCPPIQSSTRDCNCPHFANCCREPQNLLDRYFCASRWIWVIYLWPSVQIAVKWRGDEVTLATNAAVKCYFIIGMCLPFGGANVALQVDFFSTEALSSHVFTSPCHARHLCSDSPKIATKLTNFLMSVCVLLQVQLTKDRISYCST